MAYTGATMTSEQFMIEVQKYYGNVYQAGQGPYVYKYLEQKSEKVKKVLFDILLLRYSGLDGKLPNIAIFELHNKEVREKLK